MVVVFSAFLANQAYANVESYVNVNAGYQFADDHSYKGDDLLQAIGFGIGGGVYITPAIDWSLNLNKPMNLEANKTKVNIEAFFAESALSYHYAIDKRKGLYLGLGGAYWNVDKKFGSRSTNGHGFSPLAKIGVTFAYNDNVMFDMSYKYIDSVGNNVIGEYDSHNVVFGVSYKFASNPELQDSIENIEFIEKHQDEFLSKESVKKLLEGMYPNFNYEVVGCGENECLDELSEISKPRSTEKLRRVDVYVQ